MGGVALITFVAFSTLYPLTSLAQITDIPSELDPVDVPEDPIESIEKKFTSGNPIQDCITGPLVSLAASIGGNFLSSIFGQVPTSDFGTHVENCVDSLVNTALRVTRNVLKKRLMDQIVDQTVNWIQNPDTGTPMFITNFGETLEYATQAGIGDTIREVGLGEFCDSRVQARVEIGLRLPLQQPQRFSQRVSCTLDDVVGNIEAFKSDFKNGGWIGLQVAAEPQNNPYGIQILAMDQVLYETAKQEKRVQAEIASGAGYGAQKTCNVWTLTDAQGHSIKNSAGQVIINNETHSINQPPPPPADAPQGSYFYCNPINEKIVTPAENIKDVSSKVLVSDIDYILNSDDLEAYVAAIADAAINRLTSEAISGLSGLFGGGDSPPRAGGSYTNYDDSRIKDSSSAYSAFQNQNTISALTISGMIPQLQSNLQEASTTLAQIASTNSNLILLLNSTSSPVGLIQCMEENPNFIPEPAEFSTSTYLTILQTRASTTIPNLQTQIQETLTDLNDLANSIQDILDNGIESDLEFEKSEINAISARMQTIIANIPPLDSSVQADATVITENYNACTAENNSPPQ